MPGETSFHPRLSIEQVKEALGLAPRFDEHGLLPCITTDPARVEVPMLGRLNAQALQRTLVTREAHRWSRSRQVLWHKGGTSSLVQHLVELRIDDDQDALWLRVRLQAGPNADPASCHVSYRSCFYRAIASDADAAAVARIDRRPDALQMVPQPGVDVAAWQREPDSAWSEWLGATPLEA